jgi:hypothetical protein
MNAFGGLITRVSHANSCPQMRSFRRRSCNDLLMRSPFRKCAGRHRQRDCRGREHRHPAVHWEDLLGAIHSDERLNGRDLHVFDRVPTPSRSSSWIHFQGLSRNSAKRLGFLCKIQMVLRRAQRRCEKPFGVPWFRRAYRDCRRRSPRCLWNSERMAFPRSSRTAWALLPTPQRQRWGRGCRDCFGTCSRRAVG